MPEVMKVPRPPAPTNAASVALPMTSTAAERTPATIHLEPLYDPKGERVKG